MRIAKVPVSQINPAAYNPRKDLQPGDVEYEQLKKSIDIFGLVDLPVWNEETNNLVGGHQRFKILVAGGATEIEVSVVSLSLEKEKALNLALNKIQGVWDNEKLAVLLEELAAIPDFDVEITGFSAPEISRIFDFYGDNKGEDGFDAVKAAEIIEVPITQTGDLICLGAHRLICGDSGDPSVLARLMSGEKVHMVHTDSPYNVNYSGGDRPSPDTRPKKSRIWKKIYSDNLPQAEFEAWMEKILINIAAHIIPGAAMYLWNGHRQFAPMSNILDKLGFHVSCIITWAKPTFAISYGDFNQQTEFCQYCWKKDNGPHRWFGATNESTLWEVARDNTAQYCHPTQKPVALAQRAIKNSSLRGEIVLDAFLGSGSTLIAAESLGRRCFGAELDAAYCDAIVSRYVNFVGAQNVSEELLKKYNLVQHAL